jgi:predicted ATP-dependent serine protease
VVLSASIPALKSKSKKLQRAAHIQLCEALDQVAATEGYASWSLLVAKQAAHARRAESPQSESADLLDRLAPGDLLLLGARPGHGKTRCAVQLLIHALRRGQLGWFFSLQNDAPSIDALFERFGAPRARFDAEFVFEHSDEICARYIIEKIAAAPKRALAVIDHLQLLDQRRKAPELEQQVRDLRAFAQRTGCILVFLSQLRSTFDQSTARWPSMSDIRLLDTLELSLFDKFLFLREGRSRLLEYQT